MVETINKVKKVQSQLLHKNGQEPSVEDLAAELDMPQDKVREILKVAQEPISLESPIGEEEDSHLGDFIPDYDAPVPEEAATHTLLKEQLMEVYGFSTELYEKVTPHIVVDTSKVSKIDINTADIYELKKHPYLDYYQAKAIVQYRLSNGAFSTINDILHVPTIDVATFEKIKPYLSVQ
jgi:competence ComEA-like helix-hairpin-helix protein